MKNIHESVSQLLTTKLAKYKNEKLSAATCVTIYQDIFDIFVAIFQESKLDVSNEAMNLICQMYYGAVVINDNQELDPNIFSQKANTKNVETKELVLLASLFSNTPFATPFIFEIKTRS